jgi:arylsulfatase
LGANASRVQAAGSGASRPNLVIIMADDMGYSDLGCYGGEIATPNLDRLARQGLRFSSFYNCARCCPTRASLLTGLYPHQAGVGHMTDERKQPGYAGHLSRNCVTLAEALAPAGYHTLMTGKWHVGRKQGMWPCDRGFERYFGMLIGSNTYFYPKQLVLDRELVDPGEGFYTTDAFTDYAIEFIRSCRQKDDAPFFLYLAYNAPHWPLHAKPEDIAKYEDRYLGGWDELREERYARMIELGVIDSRWSLSPRDRGTPSWKTVPPGRRQKMARKMAVYAAMVDCMDQNIGRFLAFLEQQGLADNTLVMFLADNGACHEYWAYGMDWIPTTGGIKQAFGEIGSPHSQVSYGRGWSNACNTPFRLHKHWTHEGGIATPFIAAWPGVIAPSGFTPEPAHVIDLMATCLEAAGASYPGEYNGNPITPLEGKSLLPLFAGRAWDGHEALFWEHEGNRAVRQDEWKLVSDYPGGWELFNLVEDRTEMVNLASQNPERVRSMGDLYQTWADRVGVIPWNPLWALST